MKPRIKQWAYSLFQEARYTFSCQTFNKKVPGHHYLLGSRSICNRSHLTVDGALRDVTHSITKYQDTITSKDAGTQISRPQNQRWRCIILCIPFLLLGRWIQRYQGNSATKSAGHCGVVHITCGHNMVSSSNFSSCENEINGYQGGSMIDIYNID